MAKHSALTNPDDLHFAKVRTFGGNPTEVTPDFPNQILIAWDTNKVYRSTWYNQGDLVELKTGGSVSVLNALPTTRPTEKGQLVYVQGQLYISVQNQFNDYWWKLVNEPSDFIEAIFSNYATTYGISSVTFSLMYSEASIAEIEAGLFSNFTKVALADIAETASPVDLSSVFTSTGAGAYVLGFTADNPSNLNLYTSFSSFALTNGFELRNSPYILNVNGSPIGTEYLYFSGEKPSSKASFEGRLNVLDIGG
jgi:hypothetical protein